MRYFKANYMMYRLSEWIEIIPIKRLIVAIEGCLPERAMITL